MTNHSQLVEAARRSHAAAIRVAAYLTERDLRELSSGALSALRNLGEKTEKLGDALEASPEGDRGDGKGQDYGPSARASEVVNTTEDPRVAISDLVELRNALWGICRRDKTPKYEYGEVDAIGNKPGKGQRWNTPREQAEAWAKRVEEWLAPNPPTAQPESRECERCSSTWFREGKCVVCYDPAAQPDEKVCGTCGGKGYDVVQSTRGQWETDRIPCPDCQPVPPSEGEVAAGELVELRAGEVLVAGQPIFTEYGYDLGELRKSEIELIGAIAKAVNLAANTPPDGHVAVYLPVEDVEKLAASDPIDPSGLWARTALAAKQALSNGEGS